MIICSMQLVEMVRKKDIRCFMCGQLVRKNEGYSQIAIAKKLKISL